MDNIKTGNLIKEIRKEKGLTQKQLADLLHITDRAVSKWERGLSAPDIVLLEIDFTILHEDIKYTVTCNGTCRNGKIELMPLAAEDLYKDYPWWILKLSEIVSTYNPG